MFLDRGRAYDLGNAGRDFSAAAVQFSSRRARFRFSNRVSVGSWPTGPSLSDHEFVRSDRVRGLVGRAFLYRDRPGISAFVNGCVHCAAGGVTSNLRIVSADR